MDLLQTTTVLMLCLAVRGDYSAPSTSYGVPTPSTSYGAPSYDSHSENHGPSRPYNFGYSVRDFHTGADFKQQETSDGNTVKGQYRVQLPDGRTQIVTYTADWQTGFHADVQYEGEASYPAVYGTGGSYPPSSVSTSYGVPSQPSSSYGVPSQPSSSYGVPSQPSSSYGVPSHSSTSYSSPQASTGYSPSTHGSSYQSRVGVGGVGNQYQNIGYPSSGTSHGHAGY
ncbi:cuticle protein 8-like [Macrosteles quadrilineatus]|uniref:cuticle protein 8-like n=1 Tax=Macrosteles quadrilineatus TaxID=74068 RepID=UPI0023E2DBC0|nr:cuticle protein 8-like [Macrosteles quadrilineatus]